MNPRTGELWPVDSDSETSEMEIDGGEQAAGDENDAVDAVTPLGTSPQLASGARESSSPSPFQEPQPVPIQTLPNQEERPLEPFESQDIQPPPRSTIGPPSPGPLRTPTQPTLASRSTIGPPSPGSLRTPTQTTWRLPSEVPGVTTGRRQPPSPRRRSVTPATGNPQVIPTPYHTPELSQGDQEELPRYRMQQEHGQSSDRGTNSNRGGGLNGRDGQVSLSPITTPQLQSRIRQTGSSRNGKQRTTELFSDEDPGRGGEGRDNEDVPMDGDPNFGSYQRQYEGVRFLHFWYSKCSPSNRADPQPRMIF